VSHYVLFHFDTPFLFTWIGVRAFYFSAVWHAEELFYIWMQELSWENNPKVSAEDYSVANFFGQTWADFAKYGYV
jgi:hypothetical protein